MSDTPTQGLTAPEHVERLIVWLMDAHEMGDTSKNPEVWRALEAISAKLEAAEAERDAFRAVLDGAGYCDINSIRTVEHGRALGQEVASRTIKAITERDAALGVVNAAAAFDNALDEEGADVGMPRLKMSRALNAFFAASQKGRG